MLSAIKKAIPTRIKDSLREKLFKVINTPTSDLRYESFSQAGEDRILNYFFHSVGVLNPTYLDIGANDPVHCNNTYFFYKNGCNGVLVEADPALFEKLAKARKKDKCLNVGITFDERKEADFYIFSSRALNTLSKEEAEFREKNGSYRIERVIKIPLKTINEIIEENFKKTPDLISIDVEGIDLEILKSLDFNEHRPLAICVETITFSENRTEEKIIEILDFVTSKGYFVYADTHINTIFVDEERYRSPNIRS
jgi:FkbM family methyltransferase